MLATKAWQTCKTPCSSILICRQCQHPIGLAAKDLTPFLGRYRAQDLSAQPAQLEISLRDGHLVVDAYWPIGCPLVPQSKGQFRLKDTSYGINFDTSNPEASASLVYDTGTEKNVYERIFVEPSFAAKD